MLTIPTLVKTRTELIDMCKKQGIMLFGYRDEDVPGKFKPLYDTDGYGRPDDLEYADSAILFSAIAVADDDTTVREDQTGLEATRSNIFVTQELLSIIERGLTPVTADHDLQKIFITTREYTFVYLDISDYSKEKPGHQALIINSLRRLASGKNFWFYSAHTKNGTTFYENEISGMTQLCIGDGYIYVFDDNAKAVYFAIQIAGLIDYSNATKSLPRNFHFRIGIHRGPVYHFWDEGRNGWNFVGDGINGGNRVLSVIGKDQDDVIFISDAVKESLQKAQVNLMGNITNRGRKKDKHERMWRVFELSYHDISVKTRGFVENKSKAWSGTW